MSHWQTFLTFVKSHSMFTITKGRVALPNRMNFWKSAKGGGGSFSSHLPVCPFHSFFDHDFRQVCFFSRSVGRNQTKSRSCSLLIRPPDTACVHRVCLPSFFTLKGKSWRNFSKKIMYKIFLKFFCIQEMRKPWLGDL